MAFEIGTLRDEDLTQFSDTELAELEDELLLAEELDLSSRARFTAGRLVVYALSAVGIVLMLALFSRLPTERLGPLSIPIYLLAFGLGAAGAHLAWARAGRRVREGVRWALGHWPLLLYAVGVVYQVTHAG